ncbi:MAG: GFA family protein [Alphaproteobacteria bacterium]|jgi:hypothetical protein|nr:GFA family protein [Alphaproteobacteria bacterium]
MMTGSCECGMIQFEIIGRVPDVVTCHCSQCRKTSGHVWSAVSVGDEHLIFLRKDGLKWYRSSAMAKRGFCEHCGASLFWKEDESNRTEVAAGALDAPTGLKTEKHIYVADKGDYYQIPLNEPQFDEY